MAGTIRGVINALAQPPTTANTQVDAARSIQEVFVRTWRFLDSLPNCTRIASNAGQAAAGRLTPTTNVRNSGADTTPGFWDEPKNVNHGAFAVWRFQAATWQWYLFLQLNIGDGAYTLAGVNSIVISNEAITNYFPVGIAMQSAWGVSGAGAVANPWLGTTVNQWADTPSAGGVRWGVAGGSVYVLPRSNNANGTSNTTKFSACYLYPPQNPNLAETRVNAFGMTADDDSFQLFTDVNNQNIWYLAGVYRFIPRSGIAANAKQPYMMISGGNALSVKTNIPWTQMSTGPNTYGIITGTNYADNAGRDGGILVPSTANGNNPRVMLMDRMANSNTFGTFNPGNANGPVGSGVGTYDEWNLAVGCYETGATPAAIAGMLGTVDPNFYREIYNTGSSDTKLDLSRCFLGGSLNFNTIKASVPWNGVTVPRTYDANPVVSRLGVAF